MNDYVAGVNDHPVANVFTLDGSGNARFFQAQLHLFRQSRNVARRAAAGNDQIIGQSRFTCQVDNDNIFGFTVFKRLDD